MAAAQEAKQVQAQVPADPCPERTRTVPASAPAALAMRLLLIVSALAAAIVLAPSLLEYAGWQTLAETTDDMAPTIPRGSLLAAQRVPAETLQVGDVIVFRDTADPKRSLTRRVNALVRRANEIAITTANGSGAVGSPAATGPAGTRQWTVSTGTPVERVSHTIPVAGYPLAALSTPLAKLACIAGALILLFARLPAGVRRGPMAFKV